MSCNMATTWLGTPLPNMGITSFSASLLLDTEEVKVHVAGNEDVQLTTLEGDSKRRIYMLGDLKQFWQEHVRGWKVPIRQRSQLIGAGMEVVHEYKRQPGFNKWRGNTHDGKTPPEGREKKV